nr:Gag-Pol polyprotein [Tanacetum cinerariifolium]
MKWLWKNKRDEENTVIRNKARLVAKGYSQKKGIDFEESFHPLLGWKLSDYSLHPYHPNQVYRLKKALYGLKQAPRVWYDELSNFLVSKEFSKGSIDPTLFIAKHGEDIMLLTDYGFHFDKIPMYRDSKAALAISCNPIQHTRTKHIDVRYHFIKEKVEKGIVELLFVETEYQLADLFTKALSEDRFKYLVRRLVPPLSTPVNDLTPLYLVSLLVQEPIFTATTTSTITQLLPPSPPQQQNTTDPELAARVSTLEKICANFKKKKQDLEASMDRENREEFIEATVKSRKRRHDDQDPLLSPSKDSNQYKKEMHNSKTFASREAPSSSSKQKTPSQSEQPVKDVSIPDDAHILDLEDNDAAYLPKIKTRPDWLKPVPKKERPETPESDWAVLPNDFPKIENSWANAIANAHKDPRENKLIQKTGDIGSFIKWYCKRIKNRSSTKQIWKVQLSRLEELVPSLWIKVNVNTILVQPTNFDDAFTYGDLLLNDKPTKKELGKANVEAEVKSMITILIYQTSLLVPPLSTPVNDLTPLYLVSLLVQEPIFTATTTSTTTQLLPPSPPQQQNTTDPELAARVSTLEKICANFKKKKQ